MEVKFKACFHIIFLLENIFFISSFLFNVLLQFSLIYLRNLLYNEKSISSSEFTPWIYFYQ